MTIKVTYNVTDVYVTQDVSPVYINVSYSTGSSGGSAVWGGITGTLSNQTDLQTALDGKFDDPTGTSLQYIDGTGALQTFPLTLPVLQEVRNQTGATLAVGTVVYINGATGNKPTVTKAIATGDATSAQTLGMVSAAIANNGTGYVVVIGTCSGLDTSAYTEGQQLYLSYTTAGAVTTTKPYAPYHLVYIGIVTRAHPTLGTVEVRVQNGYELDEIHDVDALNPNNNDGIFYNSSTSLWEHKQISTALGYTPANSATTLTINGVTYDLSTSRTYSVGTVTSVSALTIGTSGTDISSSVANGTTTPVITLNIPTASSSNRGALSSTDWATFNAKQGALTLTTTGTSGSATLIGTTLNIPQYSGGGGMAIGGSITSATAGSVLFVGSGGVLAQNNANFFWDATNSRLGIGTNAPSAYGHINQAVSNINDTVHGLRITTNAYNSTGRHLYLENIGGTYFFSMGGLNGAVLTMNSNVGQQWQYSGVTTAQFGTYYDGAEYASNALIARTTSDIPLTVIGKSGQTADLLSIKLHTAGSYLMKLKATGNLLIGSTTDTGERLQVTGTMKVTGNVLIASGTAGTFIGSGGSIRYTSESGVNTNAVYLSGNTTTQDVFVGYVGGSAATNIYTYIQSGGYIGTRGGLRLGSASGTDVITQLTNSWLSIAAGTTTRSQINLASSTAPTSPNDGDIWATTTDLVARVNGTNYSLINSGLTGSGAAGQVTFWNAASGITGSNNLFWDNANARLGIGTNAPLYNLDVTGGVRIGSGTNGFIFNSNTISTFGNIFLSIQSDRFFSITDSSYNSVYFRVVRNTGNTLLNSTTDTGERLQVTGNVKVTGDMSAGGRFHIENGLYFNYGGGSFNRRVMSNDNSAITFRLPTNGNTYYFTNWNSSSSAQSLVQINDSTIKLDVFGQARVQGKLSINAGTTSDAQINLASSTAPTSPNNGDIWYDGTNIYMRIGGVTKTFTLI